MTARLVAGVRPVTAWWLIRSGVLDAVAANVRRDGLTVPAEVLEDLRGVHDAAELYSAAQRQVVAGPQIDVARADPGLTMAEVCVLLDRTERQVRRYGLPSWKVAGRLRFDAVAVREFAAARAA